MWPQSQCLYKGIVYQLQNENYSRCPHQDISRSPDYYLCLQSTWKLKQINGIWMLKIVFFYSESTSILIISAACLAIMSLQANSNGFKYTTLKRLKPQASNFLKLKKSEKVGKWIYSHMLCLIGSCGRMFSNSSIKFMVLKSMVNMMEVVQLKV